MTTAIQQYLLDLESRLNLPRHQTLRVLAEVEDHLREAVQRACGQGVSPDEAERRAVEQFGNTTTVARKFHAAYARPSVWLVVTAAAAVALQVYVMPDLFFSHYAVDPVMWQDGFASLSILVTLAAVCCVLGLVMPKRSYEATLGLSVIVSVTLAIAYFHPLLMLVHSLAAQGNGFVYGRFSGALGWAATSNGRPHPVLFDAVRWDASVFTGGLMLGVVGIASERAGRWFRLTRMPV